MDTGGDGSGGSLGFDEFVDFFDRLLEGHPLGRGDLDGDGAEAIDVTDLLGA